MRKFKQWIYSCYRTIQKSSVMATITHYVYLKWRPRLKRQRIWKPSAIPLKMRYDQHRRAACLKELRVAFVCDEMTWKDFSTECEARFLTPQNWYAVLRDWKPNVFLCESAWSGIDEYRDCWRARIYRNHKVLFEQRQELLQILDFCRNMGIASVFWNKEDPTFWGNQQYDFVDTALRFDYILTTAEECVDLYRARGHQNVSVWQFGFSPKLFHPIGKPMQDKAVFAGSWYGDQNERCQDMCALFDMVLSSGLDLVIYDRQAASSDPKCRFPMKYKPFVRPGVPFDQLGQVLGGYAYAVNINTVKSSPTMFARRVYELMACGQVVISNESHGLRRHFSDRVWFVGEERPSSQKLQQMRRMNFYEVFLNHTCQKRLYDLAKHLGYEFERTEPSVAVLFSEDMCLCENNWLDKSDHGANSFYQYQQRRPVVLKEQMPIEKHDYWYWQQFGDSEQTLNVLLEQFAYLPSGMGVCRDENKAFSFETIVWRTGIMVPGILGEQLLKNPSMLITVFYIP